MVKAVQSSVRTACRYEQISCRDPGQREVLKVQDILTSLVLSWVEHDGHLL
jgi:hypothetical protein